MISIKRYLEGVAVEDAKEAAFGRRKNEGSDLLSVSIGAYRSALSEMGRCSLDVCPATGQEMQQGLATIAGELAASLSPEKVAAADQNVQTQLQEWGRGTARHFQKKAGEVKDILLVMARTAESVGERDQRCAQQISDVTPQLKTIANRDDLTQIRSSIETSASELKTSIDRMIAEGKATLDHLRSEVSAYQAKLEEAEQIASFDSLTRLRSRLWVEGQIEHRIEATAPFCAAILDIVGFKRGNDDRGHMVGDELLKQFATELRSACRSTDIIGRWGGDEFIVLLDCGLAEAQAQIERLSKWVCGSYTVEGASGPKKLRVNASIGLAEYAPPETMEQLLDRADAEMYRQKAASRAEGSAARR